MLKYKRLYEAAIHIGEQHSLTIAKQANDIYILRQTILRALIQLRKGRIDRAREILEEQVGEKP